MITINSVGHFFAKAYKAIVRELPKIEATQGTVEAVTRAVDPAAVPLEDAAYALLGEISSVLTTGGDAAAQKLQDAGLDIKVIEQAKSVPNLVAVAKSL